MEKISRILPSNARVTSADLRGGLTARSGMPNFGRDVNVPAAAQKQIDMDTQMRANLAHKEQMHMRNELNDPKAKIVQDMADKFFINNMKRREAESKVNEITLNDQLNDTVESIEKTRNVDPVEVELPEYAAPEPQEASEESTGEDEPVVGQYLDVHV